MAAQLLLSSNVMLFGAILDEKPSLLALFGRGK
jgi:hypothetical protein